MVGGKPGLMQAPLETALPTPPAGLASGVYPPTFCSWRLVLAVMVVGQLSVFMIALGRLPRLDLPWLLATTAFAQSQAVIITAGICVARAWLMRTTSRNAWISCWLIAVILAFGWSYCAAVVTSVLGFGPGQAGLIHFMVQTVLAVALVALALLRYLFMRSQWQAQVTAQAEARVQALQARIRPHFLFNSLNTIASLVPEQPENAERAIEDLADLFRGSMRRADQLIPLENELELARKYLAMEQRRLGQRLRVEWQVDELPGAALVLPMLLQPLLENAVGHGVQRCAEGGTVRVYGRNQDANLVLTVSNPLAGSPATPGARDRHSGMAVRNIRSRLHLAFGERASLVTHQDESRFFAVLTLPHVKNPDR